MPLHQSQQFLVRPFLVTHVWIYLHLTEGEVLTLSFHHLNAVERLKHLRIVLLVLVYACQDVEEVGTVVIHIRKPFIHTSSLFYLVLRQIVLSEALGKLIILWLKAVGFLQMVKRKRVLVDLRIKTGDGKMCLWCEWVNLKAMTVKLKGFRKVTQSLLTYSLKIEILVSAQVIIIQTLFLLWDHRLTFLLLLLSVGWKESTNYKWY